MIQPNKINVWIAPPAEGKTYKSVQYCIDMLPSIKFIFATQYKYQVVNMRRYIANLFNIVESVKVTDAVSVLTGAVDTFDANVIFDDVNKNVINLIALNDVLAKLSLNTVIITVNPHIFYDDDLRKCINNLISHYGEDAVNIIGNRIYYI